MGADRVVDVVAHLASRGIPVWLDGGWAIDALLGRQRRAHDDLDLVAALEDVGRIEAALGELGYLRVDAGDAADFPALAKSSGTACPASRRR